jgi:hypothetical protein
VKLLINPEVHRGRPPSWLPVVSNEFDSFSDCHILTVISFDWNSALQMIDGFAMCKAKFLRIPADVDVAGKSAFQDCYELSHVELNGDGILREFSGFPNFAFTSRTSRRQSSQSWRSTTAENQFLQRKSVALAPEHSDSRVDSASIR